MEEDDGLAAFVDAAHGDPGLELPPGVFPWDTETSCSPHIHLRSLGQFLESLGGAAGRADDDADDAAPFADLLRIVTSNVDRLLDPRYEHSAELNSWRFERLFHAARGLEKAGNIAHNNWLRDGLRAAEALADAGPTARAAVCGLLRDEPALPPPDEVLPLIGSLDPRDASRIAQRYHEAHHDRAAADRVRQACGIPEPEGAEGLDAVLPLDIFQEPDEPVAEPESPRWDSRHPWTSDADPAEKTFCRSCRQFIKNTHLSYHTKYRCAARERTTRGRWPCCGRMASWTVTPFMGNLQWKSHVGLKNNKPNRCAAWWAVEANVASRPSRTTRTKHGHVTKYVSMDEVAPF